MSFTQPRIAGRRTVSFASTLGRFGSNVALVDGEDVITYSDLAGRVAAAGTELGEDRSLVLLAGEQRAATIVWYLAALAGGHPVIVVGDDPDTIASTVATYAPDVAVHPGARPVRRIDPPAQRDLHPDLALLLSTSGSTGSPKMVRLSHANLESNAHAIATYLGLTARDRAITTLPMQYCYGLSVLHSHLAVGAAVVLTDRSVVDRCFWDAFDANGVTGLAGVPHTFELLDRTGFAARALPTLRYLTQAGGKLPPADVARWTAASEERGRDFFVMYGQTEATARMAYLPPGSGNDHPSSIGRPIPGGRFDIEPVDGVPAGTAEGELVYRGPNVMLGYATSVTDLALGRTIHALRTGDLARRNAAGLYEVVGRASRFVKPYGLRVDLDEIERQLAEAGIVASAAGDDRTIVVAVVGDDQAGRARDWIRTRLGLPHAAVVVIGVTDLPRTASGKPDHGAVAALAASASPSRSPAAPIELGITDRDGSLRELYATILGEREVRDEDSFVSLGGDSLSYVEMAAALEDHLGHLPADWHLLRIEELGEHRRDPSQRRRLVRRVEMNVALRAVSIVCIVGNHAGLFGLVGGAHVLLAVAGFNFARFQLGSPDRDRRGTGLTSWSTWRPIARIALPSMAWIGVVAAWSDRYDLRHALLVNSYLGPPGSRWSYWFVETLLALLIPLTVLASSRRVRAIDRAHPMAIAATVLGVGLAARYGLLGLPEQTYGVFRPQMVLWLFALGWAAVRATTTGSRIVLSAVGAIAVHGYFSDDVRGMVVLAGVLALVWFRTVPVLAPFDRAVSTLAGASMVIYLLHWQIVVPSTPATGFALALLTGTAVWWTAIRLGRSGRPAGIRTSGGSRATD